MSIGSLWPRVRRRVADERRTRSVSATTARVLTPPPPSAFGSFGPGSYIVPPARVARPDLIHIGAGVIVNEHAWISLAEVVPGITPKLTIGDGTQIDRLCHIACVGQITIGPEVLIGERVLIGDTFHRYDDVTTPVIRQPMAEPRPIVIERGVHIGLGVLLSPGITLGENAYVGAGAVVTRDVPPFTVVVGNPARAVRRYEPERRQWVRPEDGPPA